MHDLHTGRSRSEALSPAFRYDGRRVHLRTSHPSVLDELLIRAIRDSLRRTRGNVRATALELREPYRTMWKRIEMLGLREDLELFRRVRIVAR